MRRQTLMIYADHARAAPGAGRAWACCRERPGIDADAALTAAPLPGSGAGGSASRDANAFDCCQLAGAQDGSSDGRRALPHCVGITRLA